MANKDRQQNYRNDSKPQDYYEQEYQRQLDEFNRISGAGGQRVQQIDEGVNDFDDYYDAGYLMIIHRVQLSHTGREAVRHQITQAHTEKALQDGRHRADKRHVHRTDRASREVQASRQKQKTSAQRRNNDLQFGKTIKAVTVRRTKR